MFGPYPALPSRASRRIIRAMTKRATQRPKDFRKPAHWGDAPAPKPQGASDETDPNGLSPTRYGDWVRDGIAVDF